MIYMSNLGQAGPTESPACPPEGRSSIWKDAICRYRFQVGQR